MPEHQHMLVLSLAQECPTPTSDPSITSYSNIHFGDLKKNHKQITPKVHKGFPEPSRVSRTEDRTPTDQIKPKHPVTSPS